MNIEVYDVVGHQFSHSLKSLSHLLGLARTFAKEKSFDENKFLGFTLAPDMFSFCRQVQIATDVAKGAVSRLSGKEAPKFEDDEASFDELLSRIERTISFIGEFKPEDFVGFEDRKVSFSYVPGKHLRGKDYLLSHAVPNFYFHVMTAYCLLRSAGVPVGKVDFLGTLNWQQD